MKHTKYYGIIAAAMLMAAGCARIHHPVDQVVCTTVCGYQQEGGKQPVIVLNLADEQILMLGNREPDAFVRQDYYADDKLGWKYENKKSGRTLPRYEIGDTVWVVYDKIAKKYGNVYAPNVVQPASKDQHQFWLEQHNKIFGKGR